METYNGSIKTLKDALIIIEATRQNKLPKVLKRLSDLERTMIRNGSIFVWNENESGMRRWTDGRSWSASRVNNSFLIYREMEDRKELSHSPFHKANQQPALSQQQFSFKKGGLVKKSFSILNKLGEKFHLICYSNATDGLKNPSIDPFFKNIKLSSKIYPNNLINEDLIDEDGSNFTTSSNSSAKSRSNPGSNYSSISSASSTSSVHNHSHNFPVRNTSSITNKASLSSLTSASNSNSYNLSRAPPAARSSSSSSSSNVSRLKGKMSMPNLRSDKITLPPLHNRFTQRHTEDGKLLHMLDKMF